MTISLLRRLQRAALVVGVAGMAVPAFAAFDRKNTKIIEWGWDTNAAAPNGTPFVQGSVPGNITTFEQLPFDGVGLDLQRNPPLANNSGDFYGRQSFGSTPLSTSNYSGSINAIESTPFSRFDSNAIMQFVVPGSVDWFDNTGFGTIMSNVSNSAAILKNTAGGKTLFLDIEPYGGQIWWYDHFSTARKNAHTYAQYQAEVRVRGQQYMDTLKAAYPDIQVMLTDGYERGNGQGPADENGLVASFVDGLLDHAGANNTVYDGYEYSYSFQNAALYEQAYNDMRVGQRSRSGNPTAFDAHYRASYGIWLDYRSPTIPWSSSDPSTNYFTPDKFQFAVQQAAMRSDGQVWIYSQTPSWYYPTVAWSNGVGVPQAYKDALANVRRVGQLERYSGTTLDSLTWTSHLSGFATVTQNNTLQINASTGEGDYMASSATAAITGMASVEVTPTFSAGAALMGLALTNDSTGAGGSVLGDTRGLFIEWDDSANTIYAGFNDSSGADQLSVIASADHPLNRPYVYQIERLSSTSARFSVWDAVGGSLVGTPVTLNFSGMPDLLKPSLFAQSGNGSFDNLWIADPVPEPASALAATVTAGLCCLRRRRVRPM